MTQAPAPGVVTGLSGIRRQLNEPPLLTPLKEIERDWSWTKITPDDEKLMFQGYDDSNGASCSVYLLRRLGYPAEFKPGHENFSERYTFHDRNKKVMWMQANLVGLGLKVDITDEDYDRMKSLLDYLRRRRETLALLEFHYNLREIIGRRDESKKEPIPPLRQWGDM